MTSKTEHPTNYSEPRRPDESPSLGEKAPGTPFLVVGLTYLAILAVACLAVAGLLYLVR
ncbi:hypothetical protein SAMN06265222_10858 [Neorhodopirellula lusitana]|uniref:Uncharacterized protein n=1 Tax=Neorhodopirellula lusitana TaxID=445327 RepID=A0ABY1QD15_9BACT|nr:hypothetical protein [Neorhodopirellula lusitana]SMP63355.1 hypothetical protein SAMN06265222_10858 [Neorhodopirellula lusitana]